MLRVVTAAALAVALLVAGLGIYDHQHIQRSINRDKARARTASRGQSRIHKQEDKQQSRDILFGSVAGVAVVITLGAAGVTRRRASRSARQHRSSESPRATA